MFTSRINILYIIIATTLATFFWCLLKYYYHFPNLTFDSYYYIEAAVSNADVSTWPIGYSKFIRLIGLISHSGNFLVTFQFIILEVSFLFFFLTVRYFVKIREYLLVLLFIFLFINPLFLYASNHIMSDVVFTGLSILWITHLIWLLFHPTPLIVLSHAILLLIIFSIRYSALYYPIVAAGVILINRQSWKHKICGIVLMVLLIGGFIQYTSYRMQVITGAKQFSYTGGWKQANNALYMYEHVFNYNNKIPPKFRVIDSLSRSYFSQPHAKVDLLEHMDITKGTWYTSFEPSPLRQYMKVSKGIDPATSDFIKLAYFGPYFNDYGNYLIRKYPLQFIKYVIIPNVITYAFPILEIYDSDYLAFSLMDTEFSRLAQKWFNLTTISAPDKLIRLRANILAPFSFIFTIIHVLFIVTMITFLFLKSYKSISKMHKLTISIISIICIFNFLFIILIAPSVLRFQLTVFVLEFSAFLLSIDAIISTNKVP